MAVAMNVTSGRLPTGSGGQGGPLSAGSIAVVMGRQNHMLNIGSIVRVEYERRPHEWLVTSQSANPGMQAIIPDSELLVHTDRRAVDLANYTSNGLNPPPAGYFNPILSPQLNNQPIKEESEEMRISQVRRKDPKKIQFKDLLAGDEYRDQDKDVWRVTHYSDTTVYASYTDEDGEEITSDWNRNTDTLISCGFTFLGETAKPGKVTFESVILPEHKKEAIIDAIQQVDNHDLIFKKWGFESIFEKGTAISMLFYGPPGTGKTLMGQAIADKYGYKLQVISTAEIETPEPGGAERNIKQAFESADAQTVLLFDECDGLVSSRKHMGAIMAAQVNALLTALEQYKGIVVFTTNRLGTLDEAFDRRLSLKLEFDMPDADHREKIWKRMFPKRAPLTDDIDWEGLASVEIAGGHIKNVVLRAARKAANTKEKKITNDILITALEEEVYSNQAFSDATSNDGGQFYGTALSQGQRDMVRQRGKVALSGK